VLALDENQEGQLIDSGNGFYQFIAVSSQEEVDLIITSATSGYSEIIKAHLIDYTSLTEDNAEAIVVRGTVIASDIDIGDSLTYALTTSTQGTYGSIEFDIQTGEWMYTIDSSLSAFDVLIENATDTDTFTVTVTDNEGASVEQNIVITITGTYDVSNVLTLQNVETVNLDYYGSQFDNLIDDGEKLIQFDVFIDESAAVNINNVTGLEFNINSTDTELIGWTSDFSEYMLSIPATGVYIATGYEQLEANNVQVARFYGVTQESDDDLSVTLSNIEITMGEQTVSIDDIELDPINYDFV
jgi:VCBS repeat-containing protein